MPPPNSRDPCSTACSVRACLLAATVQARALMVCHCSSIQATVRSSTWPLACACRCGAACPSLPPPPLLSLSLRVTNPAIEPALIATLAPAHHPSVPCLFICFYRGVKIIRPAVLPDRCALEATPGFSPGTGAFRSLRPQCTEAPSWSPAERMATSRRSKRRNYYR